MMSHVLGIDTGGTYTDGVLIDRRSRTILSKAKSLTTREDLSLGIGDCIRQINLDGADSIDFVALSTTLATNAIVEGRGCEVGVLLVGFEEAGELPALEVRRLSGGHDIRGQARAPLDTGAARAALESLRGMVDALAVSSYLSIRNPEHELTLQALAREVLGLPVVCAHQLTRSLGMRERTVTAVLNARLLPIIDDLIQSVKKVLAEKSISAPIMIVKGDGSLMGESQARERPIETILSGPAASIIGANFLAGERDAMILDMGGTTSDIAVLKNGMPRLNKEGARVGGWLTRVEAAEINTYGLGGDSYVQRNPQEGFQLGPERVWPFCVMAVKYPHLIEELARIHIPRSYPLVVAQVTDCYILLHEPRNTALTEREEQTLAILREAPHSVFTIAGRLDLEVNLLDMERLVKFGLVGRISVTPTDILHADGRYAQWSVEGAKLAVDLIADRFGMEREAFCSFVSDKVVERLAYATLQSLLNQEGVRFNLEQEPLFAYFCGKQLFPGKDELLSCKISPNIPVIGIGAPVRAWLPPMAQRLGARLVIPEHTEVANAVGAAAGKVMEIVTILITPDDNCAGYVLYSAWERLHFDALDEAVAYGRQCASEKARRLAEENGALHIEVVLEHRDVYADANGIENDIYIESRIQAIGTERPEWA